MGKALSLIGFRSRLKSIWMDVLSSVSLTCTRLLPARDSNYFALGLIVRTLCPSYRLLPGSLLRSLLAREVNS